ncbi:hypothetical protein [Sulfodiicoccus acidiphilus]|uniref:hypothetical protein n=1 Tax=Sulfodiicoccus acidiphilus TaxID=1670455 RepID=UPI000F81BAF2|nr:hypothetical protein [Sulfodiicoccus acidiphilus]
MPVERDVLLGRVRDVIDRARVEGLTIRVIGGAAVAMLAPRGVNLYPRSYKDADYFGLSSESGRLSKFLESLGMIPNRRFNALRGGTRLMFYDPSLEATVDVFLDEFVMCHKLSLKPRLKIMDYTVAPSDLLLTKLQIVKMTPNDVKDVMALLHDLEPGTSDSYSTFDVNYIIRLLSDDWGFYTTVTDNLNTLISVFKSVQDGELLISRADSLLKSLEGSPKTVKWKLRAKVGRRTKWYEEPEEVAEFKPS